MRILQIFLPGLIALFLLVLPNEALAKFDPLLVPNNRFGIHISQESEIEEAKSLVNSAGGDWGYITLVIQKGERDFDRWQKFFDQLRRIHIIPLLRLATAHQNGGWEKPSADEIEGWVNFLDALNWPISNKYVIVGNEPNHAKEWGGEISPEGYAGYLIKFSRNAKAKSEEFFVLPAALDFSASTGSESLEATAFLERMLTSQPDIYNWVDGWNSHSYPNPNFSGSEKDKGRGTIASFSWELNYLKSRGIDKNFPVFITETGWAHNMDSISGSFLNPEELAPKFAFAFENIWSDQNVVAVTPFIFNYPEPPFNIFSWKRSDGSFYPFYETIKSLAKVKGKPIQKTSGEILGALVPPYAEAGQTFNGALLLRNTGQSIWNEDEENIFIKDVEGKIEISKTISFPRMEPLERRIVLFEAKAPDDTEKQVGLLTLFKGEEAVSNAYPFELKIYKLNNIFKYVFSLINTVAYTFWKLRTGTNIKG